MELKLLITNIKNYKRLVGVFVLAGILLGIGSYFLPTNYVASGSFFVKRAIAENRGDYFSYEGYYSQQTAISHTNTLVALLESLTLRAKALAILGRPSDDSNLRKMGRDIKIKKTGPQIITISATSTALSDAQNMWQAYSNVLLETNKEMNITGDPNLLISKISDKPVVKEVYKSLPLYMALGALGAFLLAVFGLAIKEYSK